jgi:hypothetical protein
MMKVDNYGIFKALWGFEKVYCFQPVASSTLSIGILRSN